VVSTSPEKSLPVAVRALELSDKGSIEAVLGVAKATHDISNSADQDNSNGNKDNFELTKLYNYSLNVGKCQINSLIE
jgi:uncharacterized protein with PhoU and TrkA domain